MSNTLALEFAGDASKLQAASKDARQSVTAVGDAATDASRQMADAAQQASAYTDRIGSIGAGVTGMTDAIDSAGAAVQGLADFQSYAADKAQEMARAAHDVTQAQEDYNQALRDGAQAAIDADQAQLDLKQAQLDAATAQKDYNDAVKEHGRNSLEARQAMLDMEQAGIDVKQAQEDSAQATRDAAQAAIDAKGATLDLAEAQRAANPPDLQKWADQIQRFTPLLSGLVGVVGLITAAQWAWNAAQLASPTTWIIAGIVALIAVIVLIATKTKWFQKAWSASWKWIKDSAEDVWNWLKKVPGWIGSAFKKVADFITWPYRTAFNQIARMWNRTVGSLSWTVPGWVPVIGGNTVAVPNIPTFHQGTRSVPGPPGSEQLAILQAGETVTSRAGSVGGGGELVIRGDGSRLGDAIVEIIRMAMITRAGDPRALGIRIT